MQRSYFHSQIPTALLFLALASAPMAADTVDFRYSPPEWQTAICLPDDPCKSLVDRTGELLYDYNKGGREFGTRIGVEVAGGAVWNKQQLYPARVPIVRTWRSTSGVEIIEEAFAITSLSQPEPVATAAAASQTVPSRNDLVLVHVRNTGGEAQTFRPVIIVDTAFDFRFEPGEQRAVVNGGEVITSSLQMARQGGGEKGRHEVQLEPLTLPAGGSADFYVLHCTGPLVIEPSTLPQAMACRQSAIEYWEKAPLPFGRVQVPDARVQALVDSAIRNIWQAREIKRGLPVFQVGPTCYRGLWIVDGAFILESAAMLGAGKDARNAIAYTLSQQKPSGAFEVLSPHYYKENGIVLWTCVRHAMLTQDKAWLKSVWPKLERAAGYIRELRRRSLEDDSPLDDGLNPPGEIDGGLSGATTGFKRPEFSNVHWNLAGLRAFIQAALWLGKTDSAALWQKEYDDLYATFRHATARDTCKDAHGNSYVPIFMANQGHELPQRGQWSFCHAVYPGQIFDRDDATVAGNLAMLQATEREGMVYGTGWDAAGIWNYFASFYAHAWLWQGNGAKAAHVLYAYANHACPTLVWREEQSLKGEPFRKVGDMPHNWASAEFIRLVIHLLALDRGDELHLLEGLPPEWLGPGMTSRLNGVATPFGPLDMELQTDSAGRSASLQVGPLAANCAAVIVHEPGGGVFRIDPRRGGKETFSLPLGK